MASDYYEKLKDPRWQRKRLEILERDEFTCMYCFDNETTLHVHHMYYERGKDPWEYPNETLLTVCERCHTAIADDLNLIHAAIGRMWTVHIQTIAQALDKRDGCVDALLSQLGDHLMQKGIAEYRANQEAACQ